MCKCANELRRNGRFCVLCLINYLRVRARIHRSLCKLLSPVTVADGFACCAMCKCADVQIRGCSTRRINAKPRKAVRDGDGINVQSQKFCFVKPLLSPNFGTCACTEIFRP